MTTTVHPTEMERAAVERMPREQRCPGCAGFGFVVQSRWSWRWHAFEQYERVPCLACDGIGRMRHRDDREGQAA